MCQLTSGFRLTNINTKGRITFLTHFRDFVSSIALKEEPESPGTLRKKAQEKRKKAMESKEPVDVKKMMTGVVYILRFIHIGKYIYVPLFRIISSQSLTL